MEEDFIKIYINQVFRFIMTVIYFAKELLHIVYATLGKSGFYYKTGSFILSPYADFHTQKQYCYF